MQASLKLDQDQTYQAPIIFTQSAAQKVWELIQEEGNPALKLRVFIVGGGCSGFQYSFSFDEQINEDDVVIYGFINNNQESDDDEGGSDSPNITSSQVKSSPEEETMEGKDSATSNNKVMLLVDSMSLQYLIGATIDFKTDDINGEQFRISNPNAKTTCGCGSSFSA